MLRDDHKRAMGQRLREAIKQAGKNQSWLAQELGVSTAAVSKFCSRGSFTLETLAKCCLLLQCSMDWIVFGNHTRLPRAEGAFIDDLRSFIDQYETREDSADRLASPDKRGKN